MAGKSDKEKVMRFGLTTVLLSVILLAGTALAQFNTGQQAPDFTLPDLAGKNVTLSDVLGNGPVYLNFWATWCGPCKKEIPELIKLYDQYKDRGFKVLAISVDGAKTQGSVESFVRSHKMEFPILLDPDQEVFVRRYQGRGIPYGFLLDNEGRIVYFVRGYIPGVEKVLAEKMAPYLNSPEGGSDKSSEGEADSGAVQKAAPEKKDEVKK